MKKYGKRTSLGALIVAFTMVLSACGGGGAAPTATTPPAPPTPTQAALTEQPTNTPAAAEATPTQAMAAETPATTGGFDPSKVKKIAVEQGAVLRVSGWGNPSEQKVTQDMLNRFTQVYPEVQVKYEPIPEDYQTKLKTQISGGTEPDVFYVDAVLADELISSNKLLKLNDYMAQAGRQKSDYYDSLINIFSRGDDVYGLPKDFGSLAVFYNVNLVKEKPKAGWKWDDYKAWAQANTQGTDPNTKIYGTMHPPDNARWLAFAFANGAKIDSINSPEAVESLDFYYGMVKEGIAGQASDVGAGWPGEAFGKKRAAAVIEGGWMGPFLADPASGFTDVKYEAAPLPASNKGGRGNLIFTNAYSASANTKYPKAAAALVLFLAGPENQREVLRIGFALPTLKSLADDPYFKDHPVDATLFDSVNYGTVHYFGPNHGKILDALNAALEKVFRGQADSKTALDEAANTIKGLLK